MKKIKKIVAAICAAMTMAALNVSAFASGNGTENPAGGGGLESSIAVTGTMKFLNDFANVLLIAAPLVGVVSIIYFAIRHGAADEMDQKKWKQRIVVAVVSVIIAVLASALISTLVGYYK